MEYRYYISSRIMSAEQVASAVREHWAIESMHWVLDVSMQEDACQIYKDHAAENLACFATSSPEHAQSRGTNQAQYCWQTEAMLDENRTLGEGADCRIIRIAQN